MSNDLKIADSTIQTFVFCKGFKTTFRIIIYFCKQFSMQFVKDKNYLRKAAVTIPYLTVQCKNNDLDNRNSLKYLFKLQNGLLLFWLQDNNVCSCKRRQFICREENFKEQFKRNFVFPFYFQFFIVEIITERGSTMSLILPLHFVSS